MFESIKNIFKKSKRRELLKPSSKDAAKERLHLVLMQDRANVSVDFLDLMRKEIIEVIKKYIEIDEKAIDVRLTNEVNEDGVQGAPALYANIPIINIKDEARKLSKTNQESKIDNKPPTQNEEIKIEENNSKNEEIKETENNAKPQEEGIKNKVQDKENIEQEKEEKPKAKENVEKEEKPKAKENAEKEEKPQDSEKQENKKARTNNKNTESQDKKEQNKENQPKQQEYNENKPELKNTEKNIK